MLSGNYVVMGINVGWSEGDRSISQELTLCKREWVVNTSGAIPKAYPISIK
jgi:hypothetical protein